MDSLNICPKCKANVSAEDYFCKNCGRPLRPKPLSTSIGKQIGVYLISFFLPPFGVTPALRYLKQPDAKSKSIGWTAMALTIISIILTLLIGINLIQTELAPYQQLLQQLN